jgi:lipopolysaccharide transport system permease protein
MKDRTFIEADLQRQEMNSERHRTNERSKITIYEPQHRRKIGLVGTWRILLKNIISSRHLIIQLYRRDFLNMYKKSFLGFGWLIISPIIGIASWLIMNAAGILTPGDVGIPYPAYVLLSSSLWGLFMSFFNAGRATLDAGTGFIMQVSYPHEVLLFKQGLQEFTNFVISLLLNLFVLLVFGVHPSWKIVLFPVLILPLFFLGAGFGLLLALIKVVASDLDRAFMVLIGLCIYITPVIYAPKTKNQVLQMIINYNPLTYLIGTVRDTIIYGRFSFLERYLVAGGIALVFFLFSWRIFFLSEEIIIEKMI